MNFLSITGSRQKVLKKSRILGVRLRLGLQLRLGLGEFKNVFPTYTCLTRLSTKTQSEGVISNSHEFNALKQKESFEKIADDLEYFAKHRVDIDGKMNALVKSLQNILDSGNIHIPDLEWKLLKNSLNKIKCLYVSGSMSGSESIPIPIAEPAPISESDIWSYLLNVVSRFNEIATKGLPSNHKQKKKIDDFLSYTFRKSIDYCLENNLEWEKISVNIPESFVYVDTYLLFAIAKLKDEHLLEKWIAKYKLGQKLLNLDETEIANAIDTAKHIFHKTANAKKKLKNDNETEASNDINYYISLLKRVTDPIDFNNLCQEVYSLDFHLTIPFYNVLFKFGQISTARALLERHFIQKRAHVSILNKYLFGLFLNGLYNDAISCYDQFSTIYNVSPNASTMTILITECVKRGMLQAAIRYYEQSLHMNIEISLKGRECALQALASIDMKKAETLFADLSKSSYITNKMYLNMIRRYSRENSYEKVIELYEMMKANRTYNLSLSYVQYAILAHAQLDPSLSEALSLYHSYFKDFLDEKGIMKIEETPKHIVGDWTISFYAKLIHAASNSNHIDSTRIVQNLFNDVSNLKLNTRPLMHFMVSLFSKLGDSKKAWMWYRILDSHGYRLPIQSLNGLIFVLIKKNRRKKIELLINNYLSDGSALPSTAILNGLLYCHLFSSRAQFEEILSKYENIEWNNQTFAFVLQFYASKGDFLLTWNMWFKYLDWVDESLKEVDVRVVRTVISWCIVMDKPAYLSKVWQEAVLKRKVPDEHLYDISLIDIPRGFETSRAYILHYVFPIRDGSNTPLD